jgi:hypothetical protein
MIMMLMVRARRLDDSRNQRPRGDAEKNVTIRITGSQHPY